MIAALIIASTFAVEEPKDILKRVQAHYQSLSSFSMEIEHHNSSGLFPGDYKQTLKWQSPKRFELIVTKKSNYVPKEGTPGFVAPNYVSDGTYVTSNGGSNPVRTESVVPPPNTSPGWEVSGGMILGWLMKTPSSNFLFEPPKGFEVTFSLVESTKEWKGIPVREIKMSYLNNGQPQDAKLQLFIGSTTDILVGFAFSNGGQSGWAAYTNQMENPNSKSRSAEIRGWEQ